MANDPKEDSVEAPQNASDADASQETPATPPAPEKADVATIESGKEDIPKKESTPDWEREKKGWEGKMSKLQKEMNEKERAASMLSALDSAAKADPEFQRLANKKLVEQGVMSQDEYEQAYPSGDDKKPKATSSTGLPDVSSHPAVRWAQQKQVEEQAENERFFTEFETGKEDIGVGTQIETASRRKAITSAALVNMNQGLDKKTAFEQAYLQILHPEKLKEQGELEGLAKAQGTPTVSGASGKSAGSGGTTLTSEQQNAAKAFGMSADEYLAAQKPDYKG